MGSLTVRGNLPPEEGALFLKALAACRESLVDHEGAGCSRPTNADGLVGMAETALQAPDVTPLPGGERNQVIVHVDLGELQTADRHPGATATPRGGAARLEEGPLLPPNTARRLACDASIVSLVERDGEPISVGRRTRSIPPAIARALRARDRCCRFPGCENHRFVDAHHIEHWADGGETSLDNLVQLCRHHHRLVHEGGFSVARAGEELIFERPGGSVITDAVAKAAGGDPVPMSGGPAVVLPRMPTGDPLDLEHSVFVLAAAAPDQEERSGKLSRPRGPVAGGRS